MSLLVAKLGVEAWPRARHSRVRMTPELGMNVVLSDPDRWCEESPSFRFNQGNQELSLPNVIQLSPQ